MDSTSANNAKPASDAVANKKARRAAMFASTGFLLWFVPSMFVPQTVGIIAALIGLAMSLRALILGTQRDDGKKRETMMLGGFMALLWFFLLVFSFTANGF